MQEKLVTLISDQGQTIGQTDILSAHRHPAQYHLACSVWLIRGTGENAEILLQQRSPQKIVGAGQWGNAICGNVRSGEDQFGCAVRRLREEIGVTGVELNPLYQFEYQIYANELYGEHELDQVYLGRYSGECQLNPEEVQKIAWVKLSELLVAVSQKTIVRAEDTLGVSTIELKNITPPLLLQLGGQSFEIAPWTAIMLGDQQLLSGLRNFA